MMMMKMINDANDYGDGDELDIEACENMMRRMVGDDDDDNDNDGDFRWWYS